MKNNKKIIAELSDKLLFQVAPDGAYTYQIQLDNIGPTCPRENVVLFRG